MTSLVFGDLLPPAQHVPPQTPRRRVRSVDPQYAGPARGGEGPRQREISGWKQEEEEQEQI